MCAPSPIPDDCSYMISIHAKYASMPMANLHSYLSANLTGPHTLLGKEWLMLINVLALDLHAAPRDTFSDRLIHSQATNPLDHISF